MMKKKVEIGDFKEIFMLMRLKLKIPEQLDQHF